MFSAASRAPSTGSGHTHSAAIGQHSSESKPGKKHKEGSVALNILLDLTVLNVDTGI